MKLDNWLAQRAESNPERTALIADDSAATYAELEHEAEWVARRLAAYGVRRGATAALTMHPGREQVVLIHALMKLGAILLPLSPRLTEAERSGHPLPPSGGGRPQRRRRAADPDRGRPAAARRAQPRRDALPDPHKRICRAREDRRPHLRQPSLERRRFGVQHRRAARGPLALLRPAQPHRRDVDRDALGDLRDGAGDARHLRHRSSGVVAGGGRHHARLARADDARAGCSRRTLRSAGRAQSSSAVGPCRRRCSARHSAAGQP